MEKTPLAFAY